MVLDSSNIFLPPSISHDTCHYHTGAVPGRMSMGTRSCKAGKRLTGQIFTPSKHSCRFKCRSNLSFFGRAIAQQCLKAASGGDSNASSFGHSISISVVLASSLQRVVTVGSRARRSCALHPPKKPFIQPGDARL